MTQTITQPLRILLLGGTTEAAELARRLSRRAGIDTIMSLAGRTAAPAASPVPLRIGGFGGSAGLSAYLRSGAIDLVIDATHPFAEQMTRNAVAAAGDSGVPLIGLDRPAWAPVPGDRWTSVRTIDDGVRALGDPPCRVLCAIGRLHLAALKAAPQHHYVIRVIDEPNTKLDLPSVTLLAARGPFTADADEALLRDHAVDVVFTKNSGGGATYSKIEAARRLRLPVVMVERPAGPPARDTLHTVDAVWEAILRHRSTATERGV